MILFSIIKIFKYNVKGFENMGAKLFKLSEKTYCLPGKTLFKKGKTFYNSR